jgi:type 1 glutamine amidotransferase
VKALSLGALALLGTIGLAPAQNPPQPQTPAPQKLQALIITGQNLYHDWRATTPVLRKMLEDTGKFEVRVTEEFRGAGPETLAPYDVVVLNYDEKKQPDLPWGERASTALVNFVHGGKGLVVYHFSLAAFEGWTAFEEMCGANWRSDKGHHSAPHDYTLTVRDKESPITRGLPATAPVMHDELYANLKWRPEGTFHVLATAWDDHSLYRPNQKQPVTGPGVDEPILWTVNYGSGRVFVTALGHEPEAMTKNQIFITTLTRGTEWAATGNVTIP